MFLVYREIPTYPSTAKVVPELVTVTAADATETFAIKRDSQFTEE